ncbi:unnamed protein product [Schistosoma curassoni]|nr:unnamed protein product [Schistosoma curassoni]
MFMFSWLAFHSLLINANILLSYSSPVKETPPQQVGLIYDEETRRTREQYYRKHIGGNQSSPMYSYDYHDVTNFIHVVISISKRDLVFFDDYKIKPVMCFINYSSQVPLVLSYDLDSSYSVELVNKSRYWLPSSSETSTNISLYILPKLLGLDYLMFLISVDRPKSGYNTSTSWLTNKSESLRNKYYDDLATHHQLNLSLLNTQEVDDVNQNNILAFPVIVTIDRGIGYRVYRIFIMVMLIVFTFAMGCDLEPSVILYHFKRPVSISVGFFCQFFFMPLIALCITKIIPIRSEFGFGLLTIACSPGGGNSNGWSFLLGGDINLSMLMTFISNLAALFMMPFLLFVYGRFFIDVTRIEIPYFYIFLQLLQIAIPALVGLGLRIWKPNFAKKFSKLVGPLFKFQIVFFLTVGVYINWSLFRLLGAFPLLVLICALLPWLGFCISSLFAFILRQSFQSIITVALETGIQNIAIAILVLLYVMPKPTGELGAIMPIAVADLTPIPLYIIYLSMLIKRKCCNQQKKSNDIEKSFTTEMSNECINDVMKTENDTSVQQTKVSLPGVTTTVSDTETY